MTRKSFVLIATTLLVAGLVGLVCYFQGNRTRFKEFARGVSQMPNETNVTPLVDEPRGTENDTAPSPATSNDENPPDYEYDEEILGVIEKAKSEALKKELGVQKAVEKEMAKSWKEIEKIEDETVKSQLLAWMERDKAESEVLNVKMVIWQTIENINDKEILLKIAKNDKHPKMRLYAAYKLDDLTLYAEIAKNDKDEEVRKAAATRHYQLEKQP